MWSVVNFLATLWSARHSWWSENNTRWYIKCPLESYTCHLKHSLPNDIMRVQFTCHVTLKWVDCRSYGQLHVPTFQPCSNGQWENHIIYHAISLTLGSNYIHAVLLQLYILKGWVFTPIVNMSSYVMLRGFVFTRVIQVQSICKIRVIFRSETKVWIG